MNKVKCTYNIEGLEYRLLDPDHFYDWLDSKYVMTNFEEFLVEYKILFPENFVLEENS